MPPTRTLPRAKGRTTQQAVLFNVCLFGVAARRDCPFHPNLIGSSLLLWSSPRGGEVLPPTLPCAVRTFLQYALSRLVPVTVWLASRGRLSLMLALIALDW